MSENDAEIEEISKADQKRANCEKEILNPLMDADGGQGQSDWTPKRIALSLCLFLVAGLFEIGGGYLMWIGMRNKVYPALSISAGALILIAYGVVPTFQPLDSFGRTFAVYGGFFIVLSYLWAIVVDGFTPDKGDIIGSIVAIAGVSIAWFWPR